MPSQKKVFCGGSKIRGIWIADATSDDVRVIRVYGDVPADVRRRAGRSPGFGEAGAR
jgi:hypothetical protein